MRNTPLYFLCILLFCLMSCGAPTFDDTNPEGSLELMSENMGATEKKVFGTAFTGLMFKHGMGKLADESWKAEFYKTINGKTADEIIAMADAASGGGKTFTDRRVTANEGAAVATLKSAVFTASVQAQAGGYFDYDQNGTGEYTFIAFLAGDLPADKIPGDFTLEKNDLSLITGPLGVHPNKGDYSAANGYLFAIYLPDGKGAAYDRWSFEAAKDKTIGTKEREQFYVAYAWPKDAASGSKAFALNSNGELYETNNNMKPAWNALFNTKTGSAKNVFTSDISSEWTTRK